MAGPQLSGEQYDTQQTNEASPLAGEQYQKAQEPYNRPAIPQAENQRARLPSNDDYNRPALPSATPTRRRLGD
jgi:hypothetical protein